MKKTPRLGCLTGTGIVAALLTALALAGVGLASGGRMFSPGALSEQAQKAIPLSGVSNHAETGGECGACHAAPWAADSMDMRCLTCHTDVQTELHETGSLHETMGSTACRECHLEHNGPQAGLTKLASDEFPHEKVGFSLARHATLTRGGAAFTCRDCHARELASLDQTVCLDCHGNLDTTFMVQHGIDFGASCLACHDGRDSMVEFDHSRTDFPLLGEHREPRCAACHVNGVFEGTSTACYACHQKNDAHRGKFGTACEQCHSPDSWENATFDHNQTGFPLDGAHVGAECVQCHGNKLQAIPKECVACHAEPQAHLGQFGTECAACHSTTAWKPATLKDHTFPLNHRSREPIACEVCHPTTLTEYTCYGCHEHTPSRIENKHREEGIRNFTNCVECHPTGREEEGGRGGDD